MTDTADPKALRKAVYRTGNDDTDRALRETQEAAELANRQLRESPMAGGQRVSGLSFVDDGAGNFLLTVSHKLGRALKSWTVTSKNANQSVWETERNTFFLKLEASGAVTIDLVVN